MLKTYDGISDLNFSVGSPLQVEDFGDGTVSSLPPELYIFHHYQNPGNYVCTVIAKTVDGRSITLIQGVLVKPPQD